MAADPWLIHNAFKEYEGDGTVDLDDDTFVMRLYSSASNVHDATLEDATAATNELATANGYTAGGQTVAATWTRSGGTVTFDVANASWTASGGSITARYAALIDTTTTPDLVCMSALLDNTPADLTATDGNNFNVNVSASGVYSRT